MNLELQGKTAVITGASKGIGLGMARAFAREGTNLVVTARTVGAIAQAADDLNSEFDVSARAVASDVSTADGCRAIIDAAAEMGGADIFVSNAGTGSNETVADASDDRWQYYWDLHVMAAVRLARGLADQMEAKGGGAMVMNASICAVQPLWYEPIYNVTKAALLMLGKTLSTELIKRNIRVNTVNPGLIRTPDWENTACELAGPDWEAYLQQVADEHADIRRFGTVEEVADLCVFLCSPRASYSVGSTYHVDGGMLRTT